MKTQYTYPSTANEFRGIELGDARRVVRAQLIAESMERAPSAGLPSQAGSGGQLEATYRFFGNDAVTPEDVFAGHSKSTAERAAARREVLVIHDTTFFTFGGEERRLGLGRTRKAGGQGFLAHVSLCAGMNGEPLGSLALHAWAWSGTPIGNRKWKNAMFDPDRESLRWLGGVEKSREVLGATCSAIHVMDREGDQVELLSELLDANERFVIRVCYDRCLSPRSKTGAVPKLFEVLHSSPVRLQMDIPRNASSSEGNRLAGTPLEEGMRSALLEVRAEALPIFPTSTAKSHLPCQLDMNFVEVREVDPPEGEEPILWRLMTTEPIDTPEQVTRVIDIYKKRWLIEEFFKAIKTGCRFESLQLEEGKRLLVALSLIMAVAWRLLLIRWLDRNNPDGPAELALSPTQLQVLKAVQIQKKRPLPKAPTVHNVLMAVAAMGGHQKNNGAPGWQTLGKGYEKLVLLEEGWLAAQALIAGEELPN